LKEGESIVVELERDIMHDFKEAFNHKIRIVRKKRLLLQQQEIRFSKAE
jgi:hypothetical protein